MSNGQEKPSSNPAVTFHYIKSNFFRVIYANGIHGGVSPKGDLQVAFFNERAPIPQSTTHYLDGAGEGVLKLGPEVEGKRVEKTGIIREVEVEVLMNPETARAFYDWMGRHIKELDTLEGAKR